MSPAPAGMRQVLDLRAAILAGVLAGLAFFVLLCLLTAITVGSPWVFPRLVAATVLGQRVLPPPATFDPLVVLIALAIHLPLSVAYAVLIAFVIHRGGFWRGVIGGALLGLCLYAINFGVMSFAAPWITILTGWIGAVTHLAFGAVAGGTYEALEVERFVPIDAPAAPPAEPVR